MIPQLLFLFENIGTRPTTLDKKWGGGGGEEQHFALGLNPKSFDPRSSATPALFLVVCFLICRSEL